MIAAGDIGYSTSLEPKDAIAYLQGKGAQVTGSWKEWLDGQHARGFTVANVAKLDVLQDILDSLVKSQKSGQTLEQWKDGLIPSLQKKGWWQRDATTAELQAAGRVDSQGEIAKGLTASRLKTIFQTNMQSAYGAGRYAAMMEEAEERPMWQYVAILDSRTRPAHRALNGRIFRYDDPAWQSFYPPCGYRCRCRVRNFTELEVEKRGLRVDSSDGHLEQVDVPLRGGGTASVTRLVDKTLPGGKFQPDPGFSNNPGQTAWQPRLEAADVQLSRRYIDTAIQGPAFDDFVAGKSKGAFPVAKLRPQDQERLSANTSVAYLSSETLAKQVANHPEIGLADYQRIPEIVDGGEVHTQAGNRLVFLYEGDVVWRLALKATKAGDELYVISLFRTTREKVVREIKNWPTRK